MVCRTIEMYSTNPWVGGDACRNESSESLCRGSQVFHLSPAIGLESSLSIFPFTGMLPLPISWPWAPRPSLCPNRPEFHLCFLSHCWLRSWGMENSCREMQGKVQPKKNKYQQQKEERKSSKKTVIFPSQCYLKPPLLTSNIGISPSYLKTPLITLNFGFTVNTSSKIKVPCHPSPTQTQRFPQVYWWGNGEQRLSASLIPTALKIESLSSCSTGVEQEIRKIPHSIRFLTHEKIKKQVLHVSPESRFNLGF